MKATELRIGNWVRDVFDMKHIKERKMSVGDFWVISNYGDHNIPYRPIALTEEWLLKFGFENGILKYNKNNIGNDRFYNGIKYWVNTKETYLIVNNDNVNLSTIKIESIINVHQLQNLYFALTGEELTIK